MTKANNNLFSQNLFLVVDFLLYHRFIEIPRNRFRLGIAIAKVAIQTSWGLNLITNIGFLVDEV